jgi:hypothetical protein
MARGIRHDRVLSVFRSGITWPWLDQPCCRASNSANSPMKGAAMSAFTLQSRRMGPSGLASTGPSPKPRPTRLADPSRSRELQHGEDWWGGCRRADVIESSAGVRQDCEGQTVSRTGRVRGCDALPPAAGLRGLAQVAVVQAPDFRTLYDLAGRGGLDAPEAGCVLVEREVRARLIVVGEVAGQDSAQVSFTEDEDMIQTLPPDRADQALGERILPGAVGRREDFVNPHALHTFPEGIAVDCVTVAEEIGGC